MSEKKKDAEKEAKFFPRGERLPLLTKLKVKNFMCFNKLEVNCLEQRSIPYAGGEGDGKTAFIVAFLVGLGYDILLENQEPTALCGVQLSHIVHHGENECRLETTLSLQSASPALQSIFGPYLTIIRTIIRNHPLKLSPVEIAPSDAGGVCYEPGRKKVSQAELRLTLEMIGIGPKWFRLLLLDDPNLSYLVQNPSEWYELYETAFLETRRKLLKEFLVMDTHLDKLEGDVRWRMAAEKQLVAETEKTYLEDSPVLNYDRHSDRKALSKLRDSIKTIKADIEGSRGINSSWQKELEQLQIGFSYNMSLVFREFLKAQSLTGNVLVDLERKQIGIWINPPHPSSKEPAPRNMDETLALWERTSTVRKHVAVMGLYFALWRINESCPLFLVDSFSATDSEFKLPERVLPLFKELIQEKGKSVRTKYQQFIYTLKGESHVPVVTSVPK